MADLGTRPLAETEPPSAADQRGITRYMFIIGLGLLATTLAQDASLAQLPLQFLMKDRLHATEVQMAQFGLWGGLAWYLKPVFGLIADSVPLFGTRRQHWLIVSAIGAAVLWVVLGFSTSTYNGLLYSDVAMNAAMVMSSTVVGGLLVVEGQKHGATGRFSSLRSLTDNITTIVAGPVGGLLAGIAFGWTVGISAGIMLTLAIGVMYGLREERDQRLDAQVWRDAWQQLKALAKSGPMWIAAGLVFLAMVAPGFGVPFFYYQTNTLHFSSEFIGDLGVLSGIAGIAAAAFYAWISTRVNLRPLLYWSIVIYSVGTLTYLLYRSHGAALWIETLNGFISTIALIPLMDLLARATPPASGSFGYALLMSVYNIASKFSSLWGAWLHDVHHWKIMQLVWLNAGTSALVLIVIPFLPAALMNRHDGQAGG